MRFVRFFLTLFSIITLLFFLLRILPGGPFDEDQALSPEFKTRVEKRYHLNEPLYVQYFSYLNGLIHGDLGESYKFSDKKVSEILAETLPTTFLLGILALLFSYVLGIFLGLIGLNSRSQVLRFFIGFISHVGSSLPTFLAGPLLVLVFSFWWDLFPPALWESPKYYVLPVVALSLRPLSLIIRLIKNEGLEIIHSEYIKTVEAKGQTRFKILFKHVLKNSLIPLFSISGSIFAQILSGSFIVEQIFAIPGVARHFIESVSNRDYSLVMGLTIVYALILVTSNFVFDLAAKGVNPRMSEP